MNENEPPNLTLADLFREIGKGISAFGEALRLVGREVAAHRQVASRMDDAGWLPHHTTPIRVALEADPDHLDALLTDYYLAEWERIRQAILARSQSYDVDAEAKATFEEALTAHGHGLYRSSCRVLFPEIERLSRIELHGVVWLKKSDTSQYELIKLIKRLPAGVGLTDLWAFDLFEKLSSHVYQHAKASNWKRFQSIPNRHAAVHGLIPYTTLKNSMNTIIMADYVFAFIYETKAYARSTGQLND